MKFQYRIALLMEFMMYKVQTGSLFYLLEQAHSRTRLVPLFFSFDVLNRHRAQNGGIIAWHGDFTWKIVWLLEAGEIKWRRPYPVVTLREYIPRCGVERETRSRWTSASGGRSIHNQHRERERACIQHRWHTQHSQARAHVLQPKPGDCCKAFVKSLCRTEGSLAILLHRHIPVPI